MTLTDAAIWGAFFLAGMFANQALVSLHRLPDPREGRRRVTVLSAYDAGYKKAVTAYQIEQFVSTGRLWWKKYQWQLQGPKFFHKSEAEAYSRQLDLSELDVEDEGIGTPKDSNAKT